MSNSELSLIKDDKVVMEFKILGTPSLRFEDECHALALDVPDLHKRKEQQEDGEKKEEEEEEDRENKEAQYCDVTIPSVECKRQSLGESKVEEDNDGFKTPTSLDHKIPEIKQCPPAPRPKLSLKRKLSTIRRNLQLLDLSEELESLFPLPLLSELHRKIKKARRDEEERL